MIQPDSSYAEALVTLDIASLYERREILCDALFDQIVRDENHKLYDLLPPRNESTYRTRSQRYFKLPIWVSAAGNHYALGTFGSYAPVHSYLNSGRYYIAKDLKDLLGTRFEFVPKKVGTRTDLSMKEGSLFTFWIVSVCGSTELKSYHNTYEHQSKHYGAIVTTKLIQDKGMSIIAIGVGKDLSQRKEQMKKIAGEKGKVLLYGSFDALINSLNQILKATCAVDGGYTDWSESKCSVTCGGGVKILTRTCNNPPPSNDGKDCSLLGPAKKTVPWNGQKCWIGPGIDQSTLLSIASEDGQVVEVKDFSQLENMMNIIKSKACSACVQPQRTNRKAGAPNKDKTEFDKYLMGKSGGQQGNVIGFSKYSPADHNKKTPAVGSARMRLDFQSGKISEYFVDSDKWLDMWNSIDGSNNYVTTDDSRAHGTKCIAGYCYLNKPIWVMVR
ncbi:SCO-spondin [Stylophora pistillata]|uniref:SCO-spondin n=1 Tax=Stylophora pistillata TaxID=50429 RepID=A0A2B4RG33_STYPI|nr:SCO-spondin [Stylophora pistillata]